MARGPLVVSVISQKGGVGKSAVARLIAREYAAAGWAVRVADFDVKQMTTVEWAARRMAAGIAPEISVQNYSGLDRALRDAHGSDMLVIDGRGFADKLAQEIARASDRVLLPTGLSLDDLRPAVRLGHELVKAAVPADRFACLLCRTGDSEREIEAARTFIAEAGYRCLPAHWPERAGYRDAHDQGRAGTEATHPSLRSRAEAVAASLVAFIGAEGI